jgi:hypothetical protein
MMEFLLTVFGQWGVNWAGATGIPQAQMGQSQNKSPNQV